MKSYKLYYSTQIQKYNSSYISSCNWAYNKISSSFDTTDSTWSYRKYNIFSITSSNILFYNLYTELKYHIRSFIGDNRPLFLSAWLNYHSHGELETKLNYHGHNSEYHGYISIYPQDTTTYFKKGFKIKNKIGQIYIGPSGEENTDYDHFVKNDSFYSSKRITIGFNLGDKLETDYNITTIPL